MVIMKLLCHLVLSVQICSTFFFSVETCPTTTHDCISHNECSRRLTDYIAASQDRRIIQEILSLQGKPTSCNGGLGICCRKLHQGSNQPPNGFQTCAENELCVKQEECNSDTPKPLDIISIRTVVIPASESQKCLNPLDPQVPGVCCQQNAIKPSTAPPVFECGEALVCLEPQKCPIITDGSNLFDDRLPGQSQAGPITSNIYSRCYIASNPQKIGICCQPSILTSCPGHQVCSNTSNCGIRFSVSTAPTKEKCYVNPDKNLIGVCCDKDFPVQTCPNNGICLPGHLSGQLCSENGSSKVVYDSSGSVVKCKKTAGNIFNEGICCQNIFRNVRPLPTASRCGKQNEDIIPNVHFSVQRNESNFGEFPWQALLLHRNFSYRCGAALVENSWLITGADCVIGFTLRDFIIRLGEWNLNSEEESLPHVDSNISFIAIHPEFNPSNLQNNLAIIKLSSPVQLQYHINTLCLPQQGQTVFSGTKCFISGWGKSTLEGHYQSIPKKIGVSIIRDDVCQNILRKTRLGKFFELHNSLLCAGGRDNQGTCTGDAGGPLFCKDPSTNRHVLIGVTSWGVGCGNTNIPNVYTDIQYMQKFIDEIIYNSQDVAEKSILNPPNCGKRNIERNGYTDPNLNNNFAQFGEFPWQAMITYQNLTYKCGASLVADHWLLTAAHCVADSSPVDFRVYLGEWKANSNNEPLPFFEARIESISIHPHYDKVNLYNDLAIIKLVSPIPKQYHISSVCIPSHGQNFHHGTVCIATGWGKGTFNGTQNPLLRRRDLPIVQHSTCQYLLRNTRLGSAYVLDKSFICAGGDGTTDTCTGDGGGPLVCQDLQSGSYFLQGITAWGINCGQEGVPSVFTNVEYLTDFIQEVILK